MRGEHIDDCQRGVFKQQAYGYLAPKNISLMAIDIITQSSSSSFLRLSLKVGKSFSTQIRPAPKTPSRSPAEKTTTHPRKWKLGFKIALEASLKFIAAFAETEIPYAKPFPNLFRLLEHLPRFLGAVHWKNKALPSGVACKLIYCVSMLIFNIFQFKF